MPSILGDEEKQTVKRTVPKSSNKIHAVAVARLYIAHPNRQRWTYTGLQGAAVLANDTVGNTFWIKLVDISSANRGVIWDQEIYDTFQYNQDRTFFHSFELEECLAALSFADEKEAKQFKKKMEEREKNASKNTRSKPFSSGPAQTGYAEVQAPTAGSGKSFGRLGGLFHSKTNAPRAPTQSIIPPKGVEINSYHAPSPGLASPNMARASSDIDFSDPEVQAVLLQLKGMGITEDQIDEHAAFIKSYLEQNKATAAAEVERKERAARAPPPPPPAPGVAGLSPQNTGSSKSGRGPPPAPPPSRRAVSSTVQRPPSPSPSPPREPSPPRPRFRAPPPLADAGRFANEPSPPSLPNRNRASSNAGPPPPPRPAKIPLDDEPTQPPTRFAVPPPFEGKRITSNPPPPPARTGVPPPPPPRDSTHSIVPPAPPPRQSPNPAAFSDSGPPPPPPLPPPSARPVPPPPSAGGLPPPPPPLPPTSSSGGPPPPPPPMPPRNANDAPAAPPRPAAAAPGHDGLLADIRGGARLKKVSDSEKRDRSAALVPGTEAAAAPGGGGGGAAGAAAQGGLAGALADALANRKKKVSHSDDEEDNDEWD